MNELARFVEKFSGKKVAVLGDLVVDRYIHGTTRRISREAPVLIVKEEGNEARLGGAANVVANIHAMGGDPYPIGVVGADDDGNWLVQELAKRGIRPDAVVVDPTRVTTTKTRVLAGGANTIKQQMLRIDRLSDGDVSPGVRSNLVERLERFLPVVDALVVSDYKEGVVSGEVFDKVMQVCEKEDLPVYVDARRGIERYRRASALIPNEPELAKAAKMDLESEQDVVEAASWLLENSGCSAVVVKRGRNGMGLVEAGGNTFFVEAHGLVEVADVTGAGDTVVAAFALAKCAGADNADAVRIANVAGGIKVTKAGTAVVTAKELITALNRTKRAEATVG